MKTWRSSLMNDDNSIIVHEMISFIEEKERQLQIAKMLGKSKTDVVKAVLDELEKKTKNED